MIGYSGRVNGAPRLPLAARAALAALALGALASGATGAAPTPGWLRVEVPATGAYFWRYVPASWTGVAPAPLVLFFHGAGGKPDNYLAFVAGAAETAGCVLVLPKSETVGWGTASDATTVAESLRLARAELAVDPGRVAVAGHSAGGAYAYLLAHATVSRFSAVFSLAAPFYPVAAVADPAHRAPIRMYYGALDPNYTGGSAGRLVEQWQRLGVAHEVEVQPGLGHNSLPEDSMVAGFQFLVGARYPGYSATCDPTATSYCLEQGRFRVAVRFRDFAGQEGAGTTVPGSSAQAGLFWFFAPDNWELLVKVLDGCAVNGHVWVFAAATTSVEYTLTVTDTLYGGERQYRNDLGRASPLTADTAAFACDAGIAAGPSAYSTGFRSHDP